MRRALRVPESTRSCRKGERPSSAGACGSRGGKGLSGERGEKGGVEADEHRTGRWTLLTVPRWVGGERKQEGLGLVHVPRARLESTRLSRGTPHDGGTRRLLGHLLRGDIV